MHYACVPGCTYPHHFFIHLYTQEKIYIYIIIYIGDVAQAIKK